MKKFLKMFSNLPPGAKALLPLLGISSLGSILFIIKRNFPSTSTLLVIAAVLGAAIVIGLVIFLIVKLFTIGQNKRANKMAQDLSSDGQGGPQSMDVSAAIKANNAKFFGAIRDLKKNVGISVYDLPWYVVIGDSGCGKTKLINEGGLTFSTGKPEGYQLGTLNYNWWFSEDAIFVDMAGRLCNPQDDGDRKEWTAFLDTIAKGRKGFPINGAIVCVSADHLLQDSPEKHEADAITALERLRDLQTRLGVTFATYLVITKCDKILGFMQFFDRAERDISIKNQMFGWSRPGSFDEPFDPDTYGEGFAEVYARLNDLRMRRLNDDSEEIDLGLAYSFPEEFRRLREPLELYVKTLFPMIRNPRAVKNLLFRGTYFTSATQEGQLILKNLLERRGSDVANQFAPLDLYPNKRPHFIKDALFRKVFPEHGLVFRNEKQVARNRNLSKALTVVTGVLAVVFVILFWWSFSALGRVIVNPSINSGRIVKAYAGMLPATALKEAALIEKDIAGLQEEHSALSVLSLGSGREPVRLLTQLEAQVVEVALVDAIKDVDQAMRRGLVEGSRSTEEGQRYLAALEQYVRWFGCRSTEEESSGITESGFSSLCAVVTNPDSTINQEGFKDQVAWYFKAIAGDDIKRNAAEMLEMAGVDGAATISLATAHAYSFLKRYATLDENHPDDIVAAWMNIHGQCRLASEKYDAMLTAGGDFNAISSLDSLERFQGEFLTLEEGFRTALQACSTWSRTDPLGGDAVAIPALKDHLLKQRQVWVDYQSLLQESYNVCGSRDDAVMAELSSLVAGDPKYSRGGLDRAFWDSLREAGLAHPEYVVGVYEPATFERVLKEVPDIEPVSWLVSFDPGDSDRLGAAFQLTDDAVAVRARVGAMRTKLEAASFDVPDDLSGQSVALWVDQLDDHLDALEQGQEADSGTSASQSLSDHWQPSRLATLERNNSVWVSLGGGRRLLGIIATTLANSKAWGIAELVPYDERSSNMPAPFSIDPPPKADGAREGKRRSEAGSPPPRPKRRRSGDLFGGGRSSRTDAPAPRTRRADRSGTPQFVPACATQEFFHERIHETYQLMLRLSDMDGAYLTDSSAAEPLLDLCASELEGAVSRYARAYFQAWDRAYGRFVLGELEDLTANLETWSDLSSRLVARSKSATATGDKIASDFGEALEWALKHTQWITFDPQLGGTWEGVARQKGEPELGVLAGITTSALSREWDARAHGSFVLDHPLAPDDRLEDRAPWELISRKFEDAWRDVTIPIRKFGELPRQFLQDPANDMKPISPIPWTRLPELRETYGLGDEQLTGAVQTFQQSAQHLLSAELTKILFDIQRGYFHEMRPDRDTGWPYLPGDRHDVTGMRTVDFANFKNFLVEVTRAKLVFEQLEASLPADSPGRAERLAFYQGCVDWYEFLGLVNERDPRATDLKFTVEGEDPTAEPYGSERVGDSAQQDYGRLILAIGLSMDKPDKTIPSGSMAIATLTEEKVKRRPGRWRWTQRSTDDLTITLAGDVTGRGRGDLRKTLGQASPLAFCAYLQRYGDGYDARKTWRVTHGFDIPGLGGGQRRTIGERLKFELNRHMPAPIVHIQASTVSSGR